MQGTKTYLRWDGYMGTNDFTSRMKLVITELTQSAATFEVRAAAEPTSDSDRSAARSSRNHMELSFGYLTS